jgi:diguanylate cyclase (GGDEF)-like protein
MNEPIKALHNQESLTNLSTKQLIEIILQQTHDLIHLQESLQHDMLTGLLHGQAMQTHIQNHLLHMQSNASFTAYFLFIDIDRFKRVNDLYGHVIGTELLQTLAKLFRKWSPEHCIISRFGGDEFSVLFTQQTFTQVKSLAEKLLHMIANHHPWSLSQQVIPEHITFSMGLTSVRMHDHVNTVIQRADRLMYQAKHQGGNQLCVDDSVSTFF